MDVGFGRSDLTLYEPSMALLGWGRADQRPEGVGHPLHARAMALREGGRAWAFALVDLCFVSAALRARVEAGLAARGLAIRPADLLLTATHTHSGPSGFSHAFLYDLAAPGLSLRVLAGLSDAIVEAIARALARAEPARLSLGRAELDPTLPVARNRSLGAYRENAEVRGTPSATEAIDRTITVLRADARDGRPLGVIAFYGLHATSVHGDQRLVHPDHKGLAAARFEAAEGDADFVALFAQGPAGDVSPNVRFDRARGVAVGVYDDDLRSAAYVAEAQARAARLAFEGASYTVEGPITTALARVDLEDRPVPARFGGHGARTTLGRLGLAMAAGTDEGPGPLARWAGLGGGLRRPQSSLHPSTGSDDPKRVLLEIGPGRAARLFGRLDPTGLALPHPAFARARAMAAAGALGELPWIPTILPVQLWRLGPLVIAALPNEPTTMVGRRLARLLEETTGALRALVLGYSNAYSGYVTTPEEYGVQRYEGAYTLFGRHTFGAVAAELEALARTLEARDGQDAGPPMQLCSPEEEALRARA